MSLGKKKHGTKNTTDRVNIQAEVETLNGRVKVKVPFVMGVMAELSGDAAKDLPPVSQREFVDINQQNFDKRMEAIAPRLDLMVDNKLAGQGDQQMPVTLHFSSLDDFAPANVARKVPSLARLLYVRKKLAEMKSQCSGYEDREKAVVSLLERLRSDENTRKVAASLAATRADA